MSYRIEKTDTGKDIVIEGWENGIASSPHKGVANMQAVDINTEMGEVMCSYSRTQQTQSAIASGVGALSRGSSSVLFVNQGITGGIDIQSGTWITVSGSTLTGLSDGTYYVISKNGNQQIQIQLSTVYSTNSADIVTGYTGAGTASVTLLFPMAGAVQGATERYVDTSGATQYRYYVLDTNGRLWVHDTATYSGLDTPNWALPYTSTITSYNGSVTTTACGMTVYNGYVCIFGGNKIFFVSTSSLGTSPAQFSGGTMMSSATTTNSHQAFAGKQGRLYYPDGRFIGSLFADTSVDPDLVTAITNVQSYCSYTSAATTGTITAVLNGSLPTETTTGTPTRVPAYFFPAFAGTQPSNLTAGDKYYIQYTPGTFGTFEVYAAQTGGSAIDIAAGAVGTQYFNTFMPFSSDGLDTLVFSPQRLTLPASDIANCVAELGNSVVIGTQSNVLYPWNQVDALPSDQLPMPESNTSSMVTVNNVIYVFSGFKGNVYITNGSSVSLAISVPDYCSGLIEPYFVWGGSMFLRGRLYFSIQDQTSSHTGQCGGVWSFIPTQNFYIGQDIGQSLRMDNKNSYGSFNGVCNVLIPAINQQARGPQYWSAWTSSVSNATYGIDFSNTVPAQAAVVQSDIIPTGTLLEKKTFSQFEYKLAAPLTASESVALAYRTNLSDAFTSLGTAITESTTGLSGYFPATFQNSQWIQLQATLTPDGTSASSFVRLTQLRIR